MSANNTSIKLANQKYVSISIFQGKFYFHISDLRKAKSISLNEQELKRLAKKTPLLINSGEAQLAALKEKETQHKSSKKDSSNSCMQYSSSDSEIN